jgi:arginase family enzyme
MALFHDPHWLRASEWLAKGEHAGGLGVVGAPLRLGSISPGRCDLAPAAVREALARYSPFHVDSELDLRILPVKDHGDLPVTEFRPEQAFEPIRDAVRSALSQSRAVLMLGGDNAITRPGVHGLGVPLNRCGLLTIDAHFDLRDLDGGLTNGNPVRALLDDGLPASNVIQLGIQSFANSAEYSRVAKQAGITVVTADRVRREGIESAVWHALGHLSPRADAIYVDLDIDVLDRALAPASPGSRPGGLLAWEIRNAAFLAGAHPKVRVMDIVELDPQNDPANVTSLSAAACLLEFAAGLCHRLHE